MRTTHRTPAVLVFAAVLGTLTGAARLPAAEPLSFRLTFDPAALDQPFTGRVYVLLLRNTPRPLPKGLDPADLVQERGVVRTDYESTTLRGNLGLPVPENRYTRSGKAVLSRT